MWWRKPAILGKTTDLGFLAIQMQVLIFNINQDTYVLSTSAGSPVTYDGISFPVRNFATSELNVLQLWSNRW